eukprot:12883391-Prorocentrum_lima.AAC.1
MDNACQVRGSCEQLSEIELDKKLNAEVLCARRLYTACHSVLGRIRWFQDAIYCMLALLAL